MFGLSTRWPVVLIAAWIAVLAASAAHAEPELSITGIVLSPAQPQVGDRVTISAEITNSGNVATPVDPNGIVEAEVHVDGVSFGRMQIVDEFGVRRLLLAGESRIATLDTVWRVPYKSTPYVLDFEVDPDDDITETNENDNTAQTSFSVPCPSPTTIGPADFGQVGGSFIDPATSRPNLLINVPSTDCPAVTLTVDTGTYHYDPPAGATTDALVLRGDLPSGGSHPVDVTIRFAAGQSSFNREIQFRAFSALDRTLRVEGTGGASVLAFDELAGAPATRPLFGMLSFTAHPRDIVVRDLEVRNTVAGLFEGGLYFAFDGTQARRATVEGVTVVGAKNAVLSKNASDLAIRNSTFRNFSIGYYAAGTAPQERVLLQDNLLENDGLDGSSRYGVFASAPLIDSMVVGNTIRRVGERGIFPEAGSHTLWIHGNTIEEAGRSGSGSGIHLGKADLAGILVSDNILRDLGETTHQPAAVETVPIGPAADSFLDPASANVYYSTAWPNQPWDGYGILTSGSASTAPVALVGNTVERAHGHGMIVAPGADRVLAVDNTLDHNGLTGLTAVPGYPYGFQFWYVKKGGVHDLLIQDNTARYNQRAGIEILPRSTPLFDAACATPTGCPYLSQAYTLCPPGVTSGPLVDGSGNVTGLCIARYDAQCGQPGSPQTRCFDPAWQSYRIDLHGNRVEDNGRANLVIDAQRAGRVAAAYTISGTQSVQTVSGPEHLVLEPSGLTGATLPRACLTFRRGQPQPRGSGELITAYDALIAELSALTFTTYDVGVDAWVASEPWSLFAAHTDLDVTAPSADGCGVPWLGIHRDSNQTFYLDTSGDGVFTTGVDRRYSLGAPGDLPLSGDWNGDGFATIGLYRPSSRVFYLDVDGDGAITYGGQDLVYTMGPSDAKPVIGDWNGDGKDTIGVFHGPSTTFYLDVDGDGVFTPGSADRRHTLGAADDEPIAGDWDGDGLAEIGLHRRADRLFFLDVDGDGAISTAHGDLQIAMGDAIDWAVIGDWDGDGRDQLGVYRPGDGRFFLDLDGDGVNRASDGDLIYAIGGLADDRPVVGIWRY